MSKAYDIVVVGGGSNSLTAAAYMAKAGKRVLVLEKNSRCGGGVVSVEVAPGFIHDTHATGLMTCMVNPALSKDELGLKSRFGLEFKEWDAAFTTLFDDGSVLATAQDVDRTAQSIAKFSTRDAESYRELARRCVKLGPLLNAGAATPPMPFSRFMGLLDGNEIGSELAAGLFNSAYDVICRYFESTEVRLHYLKWIGEAMENPESNGTGVLVYNLLALVHGSGPYAVVGGSQRLSDSLVKCIEHHGGTVRTQAEVVKLQISGGRARGVVLKDGETIAAKDAVLACIHPWNLKQFIPEIDERVATDARATKLSNHGAVNQQISLSREPIFIGGNPDILRNSMVVEYMPRGDFLGMRKIYDGYRYGEIPYGHFNPLSIINSFIDKTRVPTPDQCALYLYHFAPMHLKDGGIDAWDERRQEYGNLVWDAFKKYTINIDESCIKGRLIETPLDHHRHSGSMMQGDIFGIGTAGGQILGRRPTPALANYRVPNIGGLYLTGPFMHPGGTVTMGGRPTAMVMYQDMGIDLSVGFEI
ncbi:MAG: Phytoene dehydrogenase [Hydrocarboniphaga sp.]|uniref:phytoene desaturase family protein n=1 Tax=Hydrocarboniphaga sp. TaxID=2033016 RepID=UPI002617933C|nr:NAD(P)/FAD-dependent oxidoreductase [Hydrocarboniphaga sp.]MDB5968411.1 Phytoene dehydrogenase [Hydrocarboniphaga sp.]